MKQYSNNSHSSITDGWEKQYVVKDSTNHVVKIFPTYKQAVDFKFVFGNSGWTIY